MTTATTTAAPARRRIALGAVLFIVLAPPAFAIYGETAGQGERVDVLVRARELVRERQFDAAIAELKRVNAPESADWHNLMGFCHRKRSAPDFALASHHYESALRLAPAHRGTLEYAGELDLMKGDAAGAERRLAALARACPGGCEELEHLRKAIARFKTNGNRYVPAD
jgi:hypothetical protein